MLGKKKELSIRILEGRKNNQRFGENAVRRERLKFVKSLRQVHGRDHVRFNVLSKRSRV